MSGEKILVADDSLTIRAVMKSVLEEAGYEVVIAANGIEAAEKAYQERPDLILVDIIMPGMNGYQVCRLLKNDSTTRHIPVIMLTSKDQPKDKYWGLQTGADAYMVKDAIDGRLLETIGDVLHKTAAQSRTIPPAGLPGQFSSKVDVLSKLSDLLDRKLYEATILNEISKLAQTMEDYEATVVSVLTILGKLIDYNLAGIFLGGEERELFIRAPHRVSEDQINVFEAQIYNAVEHVTGQAPEPDAIAIRLYREKGCPEGCTEELTFYAFPIQAGATFLGIMAIATDPKLYFGQEDFSALELIANQSYMVIDNARLYAHISKLATMDGLTRLYNFAFFKEELEKQFERSQRYHNRFALVLFDIDFFKKVNDTFGHLVGDQVLQGLGAILKKSTRSADIVARYGGEEFILIMPETDAHDAGVQAERISRLIEKEGINTEQGKISLTISGGVADFPREGILTQQDLIREADRALYRAKKGGRNQVVVA